MWGTSTAWNKHCMEQAGWGTGTTGNKHCKGQKMILARLPWPESVSGSSGLDLADNRVPLTRTTLSDETGLVEGVVFKQL